jgi:hypothetical protein
MYPVAAGRSLSWMHDPFEMGHRTQLFAQDCDLDSKEYASKTVKRSGLLLVSQIA